MQALSTWLAGAAGFVVAFVLAFRLLNGLDPLTGDDPKVIAAMRSNPALEISFVPKAYGIYEILDRSEGLRAYFDLPRGETLTGPLHLARCRDGSRVSLPDWLPRFPQAKEWVCIILVTDAGERRHASFQTNLQALEEAFAFYQEALDKMPSAGGGHSISRAPLWSATQFVHDTETSRRISIRYFYDTLDRRYGPFVTIAFANGG